MVASSLVTRRGKVKGRRMIRRGVVASWRRGVVASWRRGVVASARGALFFTQLYITYIIGVTHEG
ncbi:hypothetical protein ACFSDA_11940 [Brachybacterium rhamnosum]|uniref:Uncharacterized protein n=1 Tax=Brachybacterium rhamnosum TaxID=173361 RepID=A0ABW4Q051_9MICO